MLIFKESYSIIVWLFLTDTKTSVSRDLRLSLLVLYAKNGNV